jgi:Sec-independent protein translocase protein TatA
MKNKKEFAFWLVIALILAILFRYKILDELSGSLAIGFLGAVRGFIYQKGVSDETKEKLHQTEQKLRQEQLINKNKE